MYWLRVLLVGCFCLNVSLVAQAAKARIIKVLPQYLDLEGRHSVSPSLFDRDAYQAFLRKNPEERSGISFFVQWKTNVIKVAHPLLRVEIRAGENYILAPYVLEQAVKPPRWSSRWSCLTVKGDDYKKLGKVIAWRVTLWDGDQLLAEQKSFLW